MKFCQTPFQDLALEDLAFEDNIALQGGIEILCDLSSSSMTTPNYHKSKRGAK